MKTSNGWKPCDSLGRLNRIAVASVGWFAISLNLLGGCSKPDARSELGEKPDGTPVETTDDDTGQRIIGFWLGSATVDHDKLAEVIAATNDPAERESLSNMVESFESISIGARFESDNSLQLEVEFALEGAPPERESSTGTWKRVDSGDSYVIVETIENHGDEQPDIRQIRYDFLGDTDHMAMDAPTNKVLRQLAPRFVFERRGAEPTASKAAKRR